MEVIEIMKGEDYFHGNYKKQTKRDGGTHL